MKILGRKALTPSQRILPVKIVDLERGQQININQHLQVTAPLQREEVIVEGSQAEGTLEVLLQLDQLPLDQTMTILQGSFASK